MPQSPTQTAVVIPARYASSRFPGKPLVKIAGKSMIERTYEQASKAKLASQVLVATDDERIAASGTGVWRSGRDDRRQPCFGHGPPGRSGHDCAPN